MPVSTPRIDLAQYSRPMDCPNCKLANPPKAARCDCGYDFRTHKIEQSYLTDRDKRLSWQGTGVAGIVLAVLLTLEFALRLTSAMVAKHSLAVGLLTVILVAGSFGAWLWLLNGRPRKDDSGRF